MVHTLSSKRPVTTWICWPVNVALLSTNMATLRMYADVAAFQMKPTRLVRPVPFTGGISVCHPCVSAAQICWPSGVKQKEPMSGVTALLTAICSAAKPGSSSVPVPFVTLAVGSPPMTACTPRAPKGSRMDTYSCGTEGGDPDDGQEGPSVTKRWLAALPISTRVVAVPPVGT